MGNETQKRRLIAFIGGMDLCNGRYDTPRHSLFHTLNTVHSEDFYQGCISGADIKKGGEQEAVRFRHMVEICGQSTHLCSNCLQLLHRLLQYQRMTAMFLLLISQL